MTIPFSMQKRLIPYNLKPTFSGTYLPQGDLASLYNSSAQGNWRFKVVDNATQDTGIIESVELIMCLSGQLQPNTIMIFILIMSITAH